MLIVYKAQQIAAKYSLDCHNHTPLGRSVSDVQHLEWYDIELRFFAKEEILLSDWIRQWGWSLEPRKVDG